MYNVLVKEFGNGAKQEYSNALQIFFGGVF